MKGLTTILATAALLIPGLSADAQQSDEEDLDDLLNSVNVLGPPPGRETILIVKLFDASGADLGTGEEGGKPKQVEAAQQMQQDAPVILADLMVEEFRELDYFADVQLFSDGTLPSNAIVIEGRFTKLNPGSRAKRYFVGFGAGRQVMEIQGSIRSASGDVLVEFTQERLAVMGALGGSYQRKLASGMELFARDVAGFLDAWLTE